MPTCELKTPIGLMAVAYSNAGISDVHEVEDLELLTAEEPDSYEQFDLSALGEFQRLVLEQTMLIPRGEVRSYSEIAFAIGRPKAVRAVASALARNPIPLLIPCHRVIRNDGSLGDYRFGQQAKQVMLETEGYALSRTAVN